jgi:hypothetical protein
MTKKRFTLEDTDWSYRIRDNGAVMKIPKIVDLLNEQHEQIQRLQESLNYNGAYIIAKKKKGAWREDLVDKLKKENGQLKQSNQKAIELMLDGIVEMHDGKRDYAETLFNKAIELIKK